MDATVLALAGEMTIVNAATQREQLLAAVQAQPSGLTLDMRQVDGIDSAGLQLLLATRHSLARSGAVLALDGVQQAVAEAMAVYGLQPLLLQALSQPLQQPLQQPPQQLLQQPLQQPAEACA